MSSGALSELRRSSMADRRRELVKKYLQRPETAGIILLFVLAICPRCVPTVRSSRSKTCAESQRSRLKLRSLSSVSQYS